ncbi:rRNA maturation RNase YbeY [Aminicella lysinilytica]|uniref:Endoribonuclease YbeY n=1 Tax=Aminicella lysinilytica TaxID=433323 RepID=A0A4R6Q1T0_9FIRM|nr:rRNA maturation RNase YbeY [Aminicella lysinilytica]TDP54586.1 putative rRNA maturation factor [Aminicella lysinilytica]
MKIYFDDEEQVSEDILATMEKAADLCVTGEGLDAGICEVSVSFVSQDEIHDLNREYRGVDSVTDVLSFPQYEDTADMVGDVIELGDVVICRDRAAEQAEEFGHSFQREIIYLFTHSILHLLGYDHMTEADKKEMRGREEEVMSALGIGRQ